MGINAFIQWKVRVHLSHRIRLLFRLLLLLLLRLLESVRSCSFPIFNNCFYSPDVYVLYRFYFERNHFGVFFSIIGWQMIASDTRSRIGSAWFMKRNWYKKHIYIYISIYCHAISIERPHIYRCICVFVFLLSTLTHSEPSNTFINLYLV